LGVLVDTVTVGLFGLVATATGHEHWLKEREHVLPITGPLKAWIDQLPSKTLKRVEEKLAPTLFVVGLVTVIGPDVVLEVKLRGQNTRNANAVRTGQRGNVAYSDPNAGGAAHPTNGVGRGGSSAGEWINSIPATPVSGLEYDA
jgi:hypothetical protein